MKVEKLPVNAIYPTERIYFAMARMREFRGYPNVELQLFRYGATENELNGLKGKNLVGKADPEMPREALAGASEEAALECLLEAFTEEEAAQLAEYLQDRYPEQFDSLVFCPIEIPAPLGVGPLARIPEGPDSGFINFDLAPDYPLEFKFRGFFDLQADYGN